MQAMHELLEIMKALRDPVCGCRWDRKQTMASMASYSIEEVYELVDAVEHHAMDDIKDELGDLLFHVVFYSHIASEAGEFEFNDVVTSVCEKLTRRHPHVFADRQINSDPELKLIWEGIKHEERIAKNSRASSYLDDISQTLPALLRAVKLQKRAASVGFDWDDAAPVLARVEEEVNEIKQALDHADTQAQIQGELGDVLFAVINLARHLHVDPEAALRETNRKFEQRFRYIESRLKETGRDIKRTSLKEMNVLWEEAKR